MAHSDKNILITPARSNTSVDPNIVFSGADASLGPQNITLRVYPTNNGTLSFEGSAGQLFSITNSMSGTIFSVNDVSGVPSIEVTDAGLIRLGQFGGFVAFGNNSALAAAGSDQASATVLTRQVNNITTGSTNQGIRLPAPAGGERIMIRNSTGNTIIVYPHIGGQINNNGTNTGISLILNSTIEIVAFSTTLWFIPNATYA